MKKISVQEFVRANGGGIQEIVNALLRVHEKGFESGHVFLENELQKILSDTHAEQDETESFSVQGKVNVVRLRKVPYQQGNEIVYFDMYCIYGPNGLEMPDFVNGTSYTFKDLVQYLERDTATMIVEGMPVRKPRSVSEIIKEDELDKTADQKADSKKESEKEKKLRETSKVLIHPALYQFIQDRRSDLNMLVCEEYVETGSTKLQEVKARKEILAVIGEDAYCELAKYCEQVSVLNPKELLKKVAVQRLKERDDAVDAWLTSEEVFVKNFPRELLQSESTTPAVMKWVADRIPSNETRPLPFYVSALRRFLLATESKSPQLNRMTSRWISTAKAMQYIEEDSWVKEHVLPFFERENPDEEEVPKFQKNRARADIVRHVLSTKERDVEKYHDPSRVPARIFEGLFGKGYFKDLDPEKSSAKSTHIEYGYVPEKLISDYVAIDETIGKKYDALDEPVRALLKKQRSNLVLRIRESLSLQEKELLFFGKKDILSDSIIDRIIHLYLEVREDKYGKSTSS